MGAEDHEITGGDLRRGRERLGRELQRAPGRVQRGRLERGRARGDRVARQQRVAPPRQMKYSGVARSSSRLWSTSAASAGRTGPRAPAGVTRR
ncbi:MAG: hypothetical protein H6713_16800 [Myxococcales bacterium]|nr:hypothetical protein [Myxococcales bacterium]